MFDEYTFKSGDYSTWPLITTDTTIEELKFIHQKIWDYVIEHGEKPDTPYVGGCVACEYDVCLCLTFTEILSSSISIMHSLTEGTTHKCSFCPIAWPNEADCYTPGSLYQQHLEYKRGDTKSAEAIEIFRKIRDVEWKVEKKDEISE